MKKSDVSALNFCLTQSGMLCSMENMQTISSCTPHRG